jgi:hypothetical protein
MHEYRYCILAAGFNHVGGAVNIDPSEFSRVTPYTGLARGMDHSLATPCRGNHRIQRGNVARNRTYANGFQVFRRVALKGGNFMAKFG